MSIATTRPELACEIIPEGVIAARRQPDSGLLASATFSAFGPHAPSAAYASYIDQDSPRTGLPGLQTGDPAQRDVVVQALRRALENVGGKGGVVTLVVPDAAVRILLMDFDSLPSKKAEAIPLLRFRLKKLVPFDVEDTSISYQTIPSATGTRVLVAVVPGPVLKEYEAIVREAGFEPGIVLTSTLACLGMVGDDTPILLVHASTQSVTTAITRGQELLLHRTQELPWRPEQLAETFVPPASEEPISVDVAGPLPVPVTLVADEFAIIPEAAAQSDIGLFPLILHGDSPGAVDGEAQVTWGDPWEGDGEGSDPAAPAEIASAETLAIEPEQPATLDLEPDEPQVDVPDPVQTELQHALTVAAAFYEDAIGQPAWPVLVAGAMDARTWQTLLGHDEISLRDLVSSEDMGTAMESGLSRAQLGAVCGALRS
jgi:type IV pilus assembly protein PilM